MATGDVVIQWYDKELMRDLRPLIDKMEKAAARRVAAGAKRRCPVWDGEGRQMGSGESIRVEKSKYKDGGYAVVAGNRDVFYASFVELGTKSWWAQRRVKRWSDKRVGEKQARVVEWMRRPLPEDPFLRGPLERERRRFWKRIDQLFSGGILK